ncbi:MAG: hypothetical protein ACI4RJ_05120 [Alphaproteobacteria bacterium]
MKKIILSLLFCALSLNVQADDNCAGIVIIKQNGHSFCLSNQVMNWYSAHAWCDSQGRHLATIHEACDYNGQVYGSTYTYTNKCPNGYPSSVSGTDSGYLRPFWVNHQNADEKALYVDFYFSDIGTGNITQKRNALCY